MATIYIDNLIKPREINSPTNYPSKETKSDQYIYTDMHLDFSLEKNVGNGLTSVNSSDIVADYDSDAIRNSLFNIFTTKKGQKILNPSFGSSLDQYLFESVNNINAKILGEDIVRTISEFEPRIEILQVQVTPLPDKQQYSIVFAYRLLNIGKSDSFRIDFSSTNFTIS